MLLACYRGQVTHSAAPAIYRCIRFITYILRERLHFGHSVAEGTYLSKTRQYCRNCRLTLGLSPRIHGPTRRLRGARETSLPAG